MRSHLSLFIWQKWEVTYGMLVKGSAERVLSDMSETTEMYDLTLDKLILYHRCLRKQCLTVLSNE